MNINSALPSLSLDEEALFSLTGIEISSIFFDNIDDDGNQINKPKPRKIDKQMQMQRVIEVLKPNGELCALPICPSVLIDKDKPKPHKNNRQK